MKSRWSASLLVLSIGCRPVERPHPADGRIASVVLHGRLLDADGKVRSDGQAALWIATSTRLRSRSSFEHVVLDGEGNFACPVRVAEADMSRLFVWPYWIPHGTIGVDEEWWHTTSTPPRPVARDGRVELGRQCLVAPHPSAALAVLDDDALEVAIRARFESDPREDWDALLLEAVRRGGPRFESALARMLESRRQSFPGHVPSEDEGDPLEMLIALCRIRGQPEPVALRVTSPPARLVTVFPDRPTLDLELAVTDVEGRSVSLYTGPCRELRSYCDVRRPDGTHLGRRMRDVGCVGARTRQRVSAGNPLRFELDLADDVEVLLPGRYAARVAYHDRECVRCVPSSTALIRVHSPGFAIEVRPRVIEVDAATHARLTRHVLQLAPTEPMEFPARRLADVTLFPTEPRTVAEALRQGSWPAFGVLLELVDDTRLSRSQRVRVLVLLHALSGIHDPRLDDGWSPVEYADVRREPGKDPATVANGRGGTASRRFEDEVDVLHWTREWIALRPAFELRRGE